MSLKIYFCGSICGGRQDIHIYKQLIEKLKDYGTILTEHVANPECFELEKDSSATSIHDYDLERLQSCDIVIAEVSHPSLGVGYEIGRAFAMNKKICCLYRPSSDFKLSAMIDGAPKSNLYQVIRYEESEINDLIDKIFSK